jgi:tRNA nucleotidyltransferase/poly(A) polymerase
MYELFRKAGFELFLVGGSVRDRILGLAPGDVDYATNAKPAEVVDLLSEAGVKVIPTGIPYGTVTAIHPVSGEKAEITTFRALEFYRAGSRNPKVEFGSSIEEDLRRRDFTLNAMAMNEEGRLTDPCGGMDAIRNRIIDTPGEPEDSFMDDPLRILRAYRFSAKLGFHMADRVRRAARSKAVLLDTVSAERKYGELNGLLACPDGEAVARTIGFMKADGVLGTVIPELQSLFTIDGLKQGKYHQHDAWEHTRRVVASVPPLAILRWAALLHDSGKGLARRTDIEGVPHFHGHEVKSEGIAEAVAARLRFSRADSRALSTLVRNHMRPLLYTPEWSNSAVKRLMRDAGDQLNNLLLLAEADVAARASEQVQEGIQRLSSLRERIEEQVPGRIIPAEVGQRLMALGFEGPVIGRILDMLEDMAADGAIPREPTVDQCFSALWESQKSD